MSKQLQAYFRTEDEAEGARTTLLTYKTEHLEVSPLQEPVNRGVNILVPLIPWHGSGTGSAVPSSGTVGGAGAPAAIVGTRAVTDGERTEDEPVLQDPDDWVDATDLSDVDLNELRYVLTAKVSDADYEEIVRKLRASNAFVERFD
ncbi:hypothetical protein [Paenibacillus sp. DMB20]|uniref:hypothetical protein n=1 Tax=Paenibacillus sp. DMB20 TaxID=1642570 RepID=UPI00062757CD|nr:hypothetical protein [Paenibacillus sp. DMB20]KKO52262.1 hypothetical protein XI25_23060 [Paenibacillus sp. DMB20]